MHSPFIRNHHFNLITKQAGLLQQACQTVADPKVVESVRYSVLSRIVEAFPDATVFQLEPLEKISTLSKAEEFKLYLHALVPEMTAFPQVTEKQLQKLFPKIKKLKVPDLAVMDYRYITYLGWTDIGTHKLFLVYQLDGQLVGIEGKYTPANKKGTCFLCNRHGEVALFTAITKRKPANASPDYYKAIGNYMCVNSEVCNKQITDVTVLERFIRDVVG